MNPDQEGEPLVDIIQLEPMLEVVHEQLGRRFVVHRLWEAGDKAEFLRRWGSVARALVVGGHAPVAGKLLDRLPAVQIIASFGVGYDHIDAAEAARRGIIVTNTPDVLSEEVADLAVGLLIATVRQLPQADRFLRDGHWGHGPFPLTASLRGRKIGIFGLGRIGKAIAQRLAAFGLEIAYHGRRQQSGVELPYFDSLVGMAEVVDVLISTAPGGESTRGLINGQVLRALGAKGILINVGRGSVVIEADLVAALQSGGIAAAGLDVFQNEPDVPPGLLQCANAVLLPHIGSASVETRNAMGQLVVENLVAWFSRGVPATPVAECKSLL